MDSLWQSFWQDVRYSLRMLVRAPGFTAAAILSLALGIGANTTIFTLINALFLNPLPVADPARLIAVNTLDTRNTTQFGNIMPLSYPNLVDLRDGAGTRIFSGMGGYSFPIMLSMANPTTGGEPQELFSQLVTGNYFDILGLRPAVGRFFQPDEDRTPGARPVVVLNYRFWQRQFGGTADIVGRVIRLNAIDFTIVGVAPDGFLGITSMVGPDAWVPSMMAPLVLPSQNANWLTDRSALSFNGMARLSPGVTQAQAETSLTTLAKTLEHAYPTQNNGRGVSLMPLTDATIFPGMRQGLWLGGLVLMAVVGLVLLIACSNVANLLLARASSRRQEMAVRLALGAGRGRLVRQLLTESLMLSIGGGALGLLLGVWGRNVLWSFRPVPNNFIDLPMDWRVMVFGVTISLATGLVFGLIPAWQAARAPLDDAMKGMRSAGAGGSGRGRALRSSLVVAQMALSLIALVAAALFLRSIQRAYEIDPGFDAHKLAVMGVNPQQARYDRGRTEQFYRDVRERLSATHGIDAVSWATNAPLWAKQYRRVSFEGQALPDGTTSVLTLINTIDVDYFKTLGVAVRRGREFETRDRSDTRPVAIVNETMAAKYWPGQDPVGHRIQLEGDNEKTPREIVGVVATAKYQTLGEAPQACAFVPLSQNYSDAMVLYVRTTGDPASMMGTIQRQVRSMAPDVPTSMNSTVDVLLNNSLWMVKFGGSLLGVFGVLALALASVGIYGVMAYSVSQRTREMGLRLALGANPAAVRLLILRHAMTLVAIGLALGLAGALLLGRAMSSLLYGLSGADAVSLIAATVTLIAVSTAASYLPARRASHIDPAISLREA
jgi:predicted permease